MRKIIKTTCNCGLFIFYLLLYYLQAIMLTIFLIYVICICSIVVNNICIICNICIMLWSSDSIFTMLYQYCDKQIVFLIHISFFKIFQNSAFFLFLFHYAVKISSSTKWNAKKIFEVDSIATCTARYLLAVVVQKVPSSVGCIEIAGTENIVLPSPQQLLVRLKDLSNVYS